MVSEISSLTCVGRFLFFFIPFFYSLLSSCQHKDEWLFFHIDTIDINSFTMGKKVLKDNTRNRYK